MVPTGMERKGTGVENSGPHSDAAILGALGLQGERTRQVLPVTVGVPSPEAGRLLLQGDECGQLPLSRNPVYRNLPVFSLSINNPLARSCLTDGIL